MRNKLDDMTNLYDEVISKNDKLFNILVKEAKNLRYGNTYEEIRRNKSKLVRTRLDEDNRVNRGK